MIALWLTAGVLVQGGEAPPVVVDSPTGGFSARALNYRDEYDRALVRALDQAEKAFETDKKAKRLASVAAARRELANAKQALSRSPVPIPSIDFAAIKSVVDQIALSADRNARQTAELLVMIEEARQAERARLFAEDEQVALLLFAT